MPKPPMEIQMETGLLLAKNKNFKKRGLSMRKYRLVGLLLVLLIATSYMTSACTKISGDKEQESISASIDELVEEKINNCISKPITDEDFEIVYDSFHINKDTKIDDIINALGIPEGYAENNGGYISGNTRYKRWNLSYPAYSTPQIRIIVLSERKYDEAEVTDGDSYIVGIYLESFENQKGLKVGDQLGKVLDLYGKPESYQNSILSYSKGNSHLEIKLNDNNETVDAIFIDYNMKKSKEEQDSANN